MSVGALNFLNSTNTYTIGTTGDVSSPNTLTVNSGITQSSGTNVIAVPVIGTGVTVAVGGGSLTLSNVANAFDATSNVNVNGGILTAHVSGANSGLGSAAVNLGNGTLVLSGGSVNPGLVGEYFPASPGQTSANFGNGNQSNNWPDTYAGNVSTINALGTPTVTQTLGDNIAAVNPSTTSVNGVPISLAPNYTYTGGINFPNSGNGTDAFAATGVNISGTGTTGPNYTGPGSGYNAITAEWSGVVTLATAGTLNLAINSDDYSSIFVDGKEIVSRGNGGTGFNGDGQTAATGNLGSIALSAGQHTIQVFYDEGGGGWGVVANYNLNGSTGNTPSFYPYSLGNDSTGVTFGNLSGSSNIAIGNAINVNSGASSTLTLNSGSAASVGAVTLGSGSTLSLNGGRPVRVSTD